MLNVMNCVLLVDDEGEANFTNYRVIKSLQLTSNIQTVSNGEGALSFIEDHCKSNENRAPELILLDIKMPVMDGFEFLVEFKKLSFKNNDKIQIIILTNTNNPYDLEKIKSFELIHLINKPLTKEKLQQAMDRYSSQKGA